MYFSLWSDDDTMGSSQDRSASENIWGSDCEAEGGTHGMSEDQ